MDSLHEFKVEKKVNGAATHLEPQSVHRRNRSGMDRIELGVNWIGTNRLYWVEDGLKIIGAHCT